MAKKAVEPCCPSQETTLAELHRLAPDAPFLALGQTVFWDEPMKAGLALASKRRGYSRRFVAGVHDTDYFAKIHAGHSNGGYKAFPHNDTTTKGLWSAAGEFSILFGSETVVTKELLQASGLKLSVLTRAKPGVLDEATEAWGWRGVASLAAEPRVTSETPLGPLFPVLNETLNWALRESVSAIAEGDRKAAQDVADRIETLVCDTSLECDSQTLSAFYRKLLPQMYALASGDQVDIETTATTELLRFNPQSVGLPRFDLLRLFVDPATRSIAAHAYDEAIRGSEIYSLDRFGSGAIPFDLVIPGHGRGTIRIGTKAIVIMTPEPMFVSLKRPLATVQEFAEAISKKFGDDCTLVGKAVTLIGSLGREFVFVFHEGASSYVKYSTALHRLLAEAGYPLEIHPILRIRYQAWDALHTCSTWLELPAPFRGPFGVEHLCAPSLAARWRNVAEGQRLLLSQLRELRRPLDLIRLLSERVGGSWSKIASEYEHLHATLDKLSAKVSSLKAQKSKIVGEIRQAKRDRVQAEIDKGLHWREKLFEREHSQADLEERNRLTLIVEEAISNRRALQQQWKELQRTQDELVGSNDVKNAHEARRNIELEIEFKRLALIREAVITAFGLEKAGHRPSAWWFPLVSPDGSWFRETIRCAKYYLEPLN